MSVFTHVNSMVVEFVNPGDHFEVRVWVHVTNLQSNFNWLEYCFMWHCCRLKITQDSQDVSVHRIAVIMLSTPPKKWTAQLRRETGVRNCQDWRTRKIDWFHIHSLMGRYKLKTKLVGREMIVFEVKLDLTERFLRQFPAPSSLPFSIYNSRHINLPRSA
jgi:hypothetical protein